MYCSKPEIAAPMVREIKQIGFEIELVLADSLDGESESKFLACLESLKLNLVVAIRRNHGVWLAKGQTVRCNRWHASRLNGDASRLRRETLPHSHSAGSGTPARRWLENSTEYERDKTQEIRYIREIIFGNQRSRRFWQMTTDPETMPENSSWDVMTEIPGLNYKDV